ncbi:hypothetical protein A1L58_04590 [Shewanella baltica]|uniref:hypothetical protein n=1 Tax=Shewanella TaxID=22 RepID=UPI0007B464BB|nr:hypothetical protein [Shewanella baltica]KZK66695.1 hypothetical protein A1L58_04590 [Shewanella baltica]
MIKWILLASFVALHSTNVNAEIYKCTIDGVESYSQDPCADDAQLITVTPPAKLHSDKDTLSMDELLEQCTAVLKRSATFKDPDSVQVLSYKPDWVSDKSGVRRVLMMEINAKNGYGGYNGGEFFPCYLNHSGTKLSDHQFLINK